MRVVVCESVRLSMGKTTVISVSLPFIRPRNRHLGLQPGVAGSAVQKAEVFNSYDWHVIVCDIIMNIAATRLQ